MHFAIANRAPQHANTPKEGTTMFSFRECAPAEGVERIASLIPRLTILQDARE